MRICGPWRRWLRGRLVLARRRTRGGPTSSAARTERWPRSVLVFVPTVSLSAAASRRFFRSARLVSALFICRKERLFIFHI